ncbi:hypothetical protein KP79_PYT14037 [Mizuhopecten yessoensis]|uniref:C2H2-type domain-containing protein n=1 Tax=Mizuhopecten yessoensis TaxID=6573 RepID=A0A210PZ94_MIZYE|nr:hypothetical protein KP79_PYT14037 [Mizuhopecten yessoensis]
METSCLKNTGQPYLSSDSKECASVYEKIDNNVETGGPESFTWKEDANSICVEEVENMNQSDTTVNRNAATENVSSLGEDVSNKNHDLKSHEAIDSKLQKLCENDIGGQPCSRSAVLENDVCKQTYREISHKCKTCGERCDSRLELKQGMARADTFEYTCEICCNGFEITRCFKSHTRKHWIEETYACTHSRNNIQNSSFSDEHLLRNRGQDNQHTPVVEEANNVFGKIRSSVENHKIELFIGKKHLANTVIHQDDQSD